MSKRDNGAARPKVMTFARIVRLIFIAGLSAISAFFCLPGFNYGAVAGPQAGTDSKTGKVTGLPLPRFVSLKASRVNLRKGPGTQFPIAWVFHQAGLPVEVVDEYQAWRRVRDSEGTKGWVLRTLLSGRRTAQITPWEKNAQNDQQRIAVTKGPRNASRAVVIVEPGVIADLQSCDGQWCFVKISKFSGYLPQNKLWGVYKNERIR